MPMFSREIRRERYVVSPTPTVILQSRNSCRNGTAATVLFAKKSCRHHKEEMGYGYLHIFLFLSLADTVLRPFPSRPIITSISVNHHGALKFFFSSSFPPEATNVFRLRLISLSWDKREGRPAAAAAMPAAGEGGRQDARGAYTRYVRIYLVRASGLRASAPSPPPYSLSWDPDSTSESQFTSRTPTRSI